MVNEGEIRTDVDRLIALVKGKKEISIEDAAKQLGISAKTVEALSDLLEEEGMLHVRYKFTTPYITSEMPSSKTKAAKKAKEDEFVIEKEGDIEKVSVDAQKAEIRPAAPGEIKTQKTEEQKAEAAKAVKEGKKPDILRTDDIDELIKNANECISKGDFEGARQIYLRIKSIREDLPKRFLEKEKEVSVDLADLSENIVSGIDNALSTDFSKKVNDIENLFKEAQMKIELNKIKSNDDLERVEEIYKKIKEIYVSLPSGFMEKKIVIQDRMLELYRTVLLNRKEILTADYTKKSAEIASIMNSLAAKMNEGSIAEANKLFNGMVAVYRSLPKGFLKEKTDLQNNILGMYQRLVVLKDNYFSNDIRVKADQIRKLISDATDFVHNNDIRLANEMYRKATDIYSTLPKGFYDVRADLELKMLDLQHLLSLRQGKATLEEMKAKVAEIDTLIESADNYIKNREYDLAKEVYQEIISAYNSLPEGFIETNLKLREKIVKLYKDVLSFKIMPAEGEIGSDISKKYSDLLKLLVQVHESIKNMKFDRIKEKYLAAYKIYHELPLSFVESKTDVYKELYKIYEELKLYGELKRLSEYANNKDYDSLKESLNLIIDSHTKLSNKYPEDMEFFNYVHSNCLVYISILNEKKIETGKDVREKIENMKDLKKSPVIIRPEEIKEYAEKSSAAVEKTITQSQAPDAREYLQKKFNAK